MRRIIAIGGTEPKSNETLTIDKEVVTLTGKKNPSVLFIPTASGDSVKYIKLFKKTYGDVLGCTVDNLLLFENRLTYDEIKMKILSADAIYVGGGNTLRMMKMWKKRRVDLLLKEAHEKEGIVLAGVSAGAICWFEHGHSDSRSFSNPKDWSAIKVKGLGLVPYIVCPHYHYETREDDFERMLSKHRLNVGIALDNNAAIEIVDDQFRIIKGSDESKAYKVIKRDINFSREELTNTEFEALSSIGI